MKLVQYNCIEQRSYPTILIDDRWGVVSRKRFKKELAKRKTKVWLALYGGE